MTQIASTASPLRKPPAADPFAIGWRDVRRALPDGRTIVEQVPLTLADALHPQEGDTILQNTVHNREWRYLQNVIERRMAGDPHALVLGDCKVLWEDGIHHSPDLAIILGVREVRDAYSQFDVATEGVRPRLIIEVVSPTTRSNDVREKFEQYHHYRVPLYVIVDRESEDDPPRVIGYQRRPQRYVPLPPEEDGRLWLEPVNLYLGVSGNRVVAYDGDTGAELGDYTAVSAALAAEQERADAETQRADAERQRADAERQRADAAETRLRELEAELLRRPAPPAQP